MKLTYKILTLILVVFFFNSCKDNDEVEKEEETVVEDNSNNLNISILLDLSDRISPEEYSNSTMEYYKRDVGYIKSIAECFTDHVKSKRIRQVNDKIQLYFEPEPLNPEINLISDKLKFSLTKENISNDILEKINNTYSTEALAIYELAIQDKKYVGSDTWKFFKNNVNDYCIREKYRNILVVLTDGYMYHINSKIKESNKTTYITPETIRSNKLNTSNWAQIMKDQEIGFIKSNDDLSNLEVLVLGINPSSKNPYEEDVIKAFWINWLEEMKVKEIEVKNAELPSNMDKIIKDFINKK
jgi:hypothetical protein